MKKAKKFKTKYLDRDRELIEFRLGEIEKTYHQIEDDSEMYGAIGSMGINARNVWDRAQEHIDRYNRDELQLSCMEMADYLATIHILTRDYDAGAQNQRSFGLMVGWYSLHDSLSALASELQINEGGSKCWPIGSEC